MFTEEELKSFLDRKIKSDEDIGEHAGGSGHLSDVGYELKDYSSKELSESKLEIIYQYIVYVTTEFTYYPDNPPYEYPHKKKLIVDNEMKILSEEELHSDYTSNRSEAEDLDVIEFEWVTAQDDIKKYIEELLTRIEWKYGDNRAPIKYPPTFGTEVDSENKQKYKCIIGVENGDDEKLVFKSENPLNLVDQVKRDLGNRYKFD